MQIDPHALSGLATTALEFAKEMLAAHGEFYPFAYAINPSGAVEAVAADMGQEHPEKRELYQFLNAGLAAAVNEGQYVAVALAADVTIPAEYEPNFADGVRVLLEAPGYARFLYLPYQLAPKGGLLRFIRSRKGPEYGELFSVEIPPVVYKPRDG